MAYGLKEAPFSCVLFFFLFLSAETDQRGSYPDKPRCIAAWGGNTLTCAGAYEHRPRPYGHWPRSGCSPVRPSVGGSDGEFLTPERLAHVTDYGAAPYHLLEDRCTHSEDGARISEWQISVAEVRAFVERQARK